MDPEFGIGRQLAPHPFDYIPAGHHNAIIFRRSDYDCADDLQRMLDDWNPVRGYAGIEDFPSGRYALGKPLIWANWISWRGGGRGTQFFALPGHTGPYMFQFDSDPDKVKDGSGVASPLLDQRGYGQGVYPSSAFNQRLEGFDINANGQDNIDWVIYAPSWNEKCGLRDVMARNVPKGFLMIDEWHGGSAGFGISDLEVHFAASAHDSATVGMLFRGLARDDSPILNRPQVTLRNVSMTCARPGGDPEPASDLIMIAAENIHLQLLGGIHFEQAQYGIVASRDGHVTGFGVTGSHDAGEVTNLFVRSGNHVGRIDVRDVYPGTGGGQVLRDNKTGIHRTDAVGAAISVPSLPGEAWSSGRFKVSNPGGGMAVTESQLLGCSAVIRDGATGFFKVTHSDAFPTGDDYTVVAEAHDATACYAVAKPSERVGATFHIRVYRESDDTLFDAAEVTFRVYREPEA